MIIRHSNVRLFRSFGMHTRISITLLSCLFLSGALFAEKSRPPKTDLKTILEAYKVFVNKFEAKGKNPPKTSNIYQWAFQLAIHADLNSAKLYYLPQDPAVQFFQGRLPEQIAVPSKQGDPIINPTFDKTPISYEVALNLKVKDFERSNLPVIWTRGLNPDLSWATIGTYGEKGGYIAFANGTVRWIPQKKTSEPPEKIFNDYKNPEKPTANLISALPPSTLIGRYKTPLKLLHTVETQNRFMSYMKMALWISISGIPVIILLFKLKRAKSDPTANRRSF